MYLSVETDFDELVLGAETDEVAQGVDLVELGFEDGSALAAGKSEQLARRSPRSIF